MLPDLDNKLPDVLMFLYNVMVASEPLLVLAAEKSNGALQEYFKDHLEEERSHDQWLKEDLLGYDIETIPEDHIAAAMAGSQYYWINHGHPEYLLGYMYFLEGSPMPMGQVEHLEEIYGKGLLRTLRYHATHDPDHVKDIRAMIALQPNKDAILYNAKQTAEYYAYAMKRIALCQ